MKVTNYSENVAMLRALKEIAKITSQLGPDRPSAQYMAETAKMWIRCGAFSAPRPPRFGRRRWGNDKY